MVTRCGGTYEISEPFRQQILIKINLREYKPIKCLRWIFNSSISIWAIDPRKPVANHSRLAIDRIFIVAKAGGQIGSSTFARHDLSWSKCPSPGLVRVGGSHELGLQFGDVGVRIGVREGGRRGVDGPGCNMDLFMQGVRV